MRGVQEIDFDPANVDPNILFGATTISAAVGAEVALTLLADLGEQAGVGRKIFLDNETASEVNDNTTWTITGTDADGNPQTDTMTDVEDAGASVVGKNVSNKYFNSVTTIELNDVEVDITSAIIGTIGAMCSKAIMLDKYAVNSPLVVVTQTGTVAWELEATVEVLDNSKNQGDVTWVNDPSAESASATQQDNLQDWPVAYMRLVTTTYTDTAELAVKVSQGY